ncbi:hypothetical protein PM030_04515 [Halorubrum ezzemoulense]|uniref:hypothetical protein n=1 Tax=Halorubrum ezzemoulense TaxID=337243 RepID=UPI00232F142D|nr:hypothetical protein [Halorubrum ezzemoulense]MDB2281131.1 hypothetical protein [Halorubrum ezzemoulense]
MSHTPTWNTGVSPDFGSLSTVPIPSDDAVRDVLGEARSLDSDADAVTANTHGLVPPNVALHDLLFNPEPTRPEIISGTIVVYVAETLHVEGRDRQGVIRATVRADAETHEIESVELTAEIA